MPSVLLWTHPTAMTRDISRTFSRWVSHWVSFFLQRSMPCAASCERIVACFHDMQLLMCSTNKENIIFGAMIVQQQRWSCLIKGKILGNSLLFSFHKLVNHLESREEPVVSRHMLNKEVIPFTQLPITMKVDHWYWWSCKQSSHVSEGKNTTAISRNIPSKHYHPPDCWQFVSNPTLHEVWIFNIQNVRYTTHGMSFILVLHAFCANQRCSCCPQLRALLRPWAKSCSDRNSGDALRAFAKKDKAWPRRETDGGEMARLAMAVHVSQQQRPAVGLINSQQQDGWLLTNILFSHFSS